MIDSDEDWINAGCPNVWPPDSELHEVIQKSIEKLEAGRKQSISKQNSNLAAIGRKGNELIF